MFVLSAQQTSVLYSRLTDLKLFIYKKLFFRTTEKSFLNQTTLDLRKERRTFLNREFTVLTSNHCSFIRRLSDKNLGRNSICWHTGNPNHKKQKHQSFFSASEHHPCHHCIIWKQKQKAITFYLWVFNTMKRTLLNWCNLVSISK